MTHVLVGFGIGLAAWTLLEYAIHYWLGHLPKGRTLISSEHLAHHRDILYFTPLRLKVRGAVPVLAGLGVAAWAAVGAAFAAGFVAAVAAGWTTYEALHQSIHVNGPRTRYGRWAARTHLHHHFVRPNANHGVTTPIWDHVFRTHVPVRRVRIPARRVDSVPWLAEALRPGAPRPDFLADYEIA
jgi:sterol desaturase/sphingolipid hydroxylase (fatty acid hydroxylase superfamily)